MKYIMRFIYLFFFPYYLIAQTTTINYTSSNDDIVNPERGFYTYSERRTSTSSALNSSDMMSRRNGYTPYSASYAVKSSLVFRYFFLEDFRVVGNANQVIDISQAYLNAIETDLNNARTAGVKVIARFAYTDSVDGSTCSDWICSPYGDANKATILRHIEQLKPIFEAHADVISSVQMGFIGVWGEQYYTDFFDDADATPSNNKFGAYTTQQWQDRMDVLHALLDAVPTTRMVQVRYPQMKQKAIYGINAGISSAALGESEAYNESDIARIGFHNDCFLASETDFGTFINYDNNSSNSSTVSTIKNYKADDSKYVVVGGETCSAFNPKDNCDNQSGGGAETDLAAYHYSYLNSEYNNDAVNDDWVTQGCIEDIKKKLGYRFVLEQGTFTNQAQPGQQITIQLSLKNEGYAAPYNERGVEIILRNTATDEQFYAKLNEDPRKWLSGSTTNIEANICLPSSMPIGTYKLFLNLPDPMKSIYDRSEYSIQLANQNTWESSTGYNDLQHTLTVNNSANANVCDGGIGISNGSTFMALQVECKVLLQGAWNTGTMMSDPLRVNGLLPDFEPYSGSISNEAGSNIEINVLNNGGDDAIVDWVLLELRDESNPTTIIASRKALVQKDGDVVDMDGVSPVAFWGVASGQYYLAVHHRNHLSILTSTALDFE